MSINKWRQQIDDIDQEILQLMGQRAACSLSIAKEKQNADFTFRILREIQIHQKIKELQSHPYNKYEALHYMWRIIMNVSNLIQTKDEKSSQGQKIQIFYHKKYEKILQQIIDRLFLCHPDIKSLDCAEFFNQIEKQPKAVFLTQINEETTKFLAKLPKLQQRLFVELFVEKIKQKNFFVITYSEEENMQNLPHLSIAQKIPFEYQKEIFTDSQYTVFTQKTFETFETFAQNLSKTVVLGRYTSLPFSFNLSTFAAS